MTENGYLQSFVESNRESKNDYRDSGFNEEDSYHNLKNTPTDKFNKINSFNISSSSDRNSDKEKNGSSNKFNEFICIINILSSTLGGGALVFPYILYQVGLITSLILFIIVSISVYYSLDLLRRFVINSKLFSFSIITQATLGNLWLRISAFSAFLFYMACIINYLVILYNFTNSMLDFIKEHWGKLIYFLISCSIEIILCIFTNKISKIHYLSLIVVFIFVIIIIVLIIKSIIVFINDQYKSFSLFTIEDDNIPNITNWNTFLIIMAKIIEFFYGFIYHSTFPSLLSRLNNIDDRSSKKVQIISYILLNIIYIFFLLFGFSFYDKDSDFIFGKNIDISIYFLEIIFKCILVILFMTLIPIRYIVIRDNYTSLIGKEELPLKYEFLITSICLIINNLIVYFTGDSKSFISKLIHYFGGVLGVFISFVLPFISYMAINEKYNLRIIFGYIIVGIFIVIGFFSVFYSFKSEDNGITN